MNCSVLITVLWSDGDSVHHLWTGLARLVSLQLEGPLEDSVLDWRSGSSGWAVQYWLHCCKCPPGCRFCRQWNFTLKLNKECDFYRHAGEGCVLCRVSKYCCPGPLRFVQLVDFCTFQWCWGKLMHSFNHKVFYSELSCKYLPSV